MTRWEWTQAGVSVGAALIVAYGGYWVGGKILGVTYPERQGYVVEGVAPVELADLQRSWPDGFSESGEPEKLAGYMDSIEHARVPIPASAVTVQAAEPQVDLGTRLATADPAKGKRTAQVCASCHTFDQGGPNHTGPNLWGIVGRRRAAQPGFAYSPAMAKHGGSWTFDDLDTYLTSPAKFVPGNKMAFAGIRNPTDRANVVAYLASLSNSPLAFPKAKPAARLADAAP